MSSGEFGYWLGTVVFMVLPSYLMFRYGTKHRNKTWLTLGTLWNWLYVVLIPATIPAAVALIATAYAVSAWPSRQSD